MKKISHYLFPIMMALYFVIILPSPDVDAAKKKKTMTLDVQCSPLGMDGGTDTRVTGKVSLQRQVNGSYLGEGSLSVRISRAREGVLLEATDIPILAQFDDILIPTLRAMPKQRPEIESDFSIFTLFQKKSDVETVRPLFSQVEMTDGRVYETECDLKY